MRSRRGALTAQPSAGLLDLVKRNEYKRRQASGRAASAAPPSGAIGAIRSRTAIGASPHQRRHQDFSGPLPGRLLRIREMSAYTWRA